MNEPDAKIVYYPLKGNEPLHAELTMTVRTAGGSFDGIALRRFATALMPNSVLTEERSLGEQIQRSALMQRILAEAGILLGVLSQLMVGVAIYAMLARRVQAASREIGVRMALGARHHTIVLTTVSSALFAVLIGVSAGLAGGVVLVYFMRELLYRVDWYQPEIVLLTLGVTTITSLAAALQPSLKAVRMNPADALRIT